MTGWQDLQEQHSIVFTSLASVNDLQNQQLK